MFSFIKEKITSFCSSFTHSLSGFFSHKQFDNEAFKELEIMLLSADVGVKTATYIINKLKAEITPNTEPEKVREIFKSILSTILSIPTAKQAPISLLVGINGSGKTTFASKLAHLHIQKGEKVLLVAADTFRAAATEQLSEWAQSIGAEIHCAQSNQDPASVVYQGCERYKKEGFDKLIIDTAGRLQTKKNLMMELAKIKKIITKQMGDIPVHTFLTIDGMLGQNSFEQARLFKECTDVSSIILTKMDSTGKGGIIFALAHELSLPISFITFGEKKDDIAVFDSSSYIRELMNG